jgi:hypothetical protein
MARMTRFEGRRVGGITGYDRRIAARAKASDVRRCVSALKYGDLNAGRGAGTIGSFDTVRLDAQPVGATDAANLQVQLNGVFGRGTTIGQVVIATDVVRLTIMPPDLVAQVNAMRALCRARGVPFQERDEHRRGHYDNLARQLERVVRGTLVQSTQDGGAYRIVVAS